MTPIYTGAFFDPVNRRPGMGKRIVLGSCFETIKLNHVTLSFRPSQEELDRTPLGKEILLRVVGKAPNARLRSAGRAR